MTIYSLGGALPTRQSSQIDAGHSRPLQASNSCFFIVHLKSASPWNACHSKLVAPRSTAAASSQLFCIMDQRLGVALKSPQGSVHDDIESII